MILPNSSLSLALIKKGYKMGICQKFGLIGRTLKHSYSVKIHNLLADYPYDLYELESEDIPAFLSGDIKGFNVTIPYKTEIIKYLDEISGIAKEIGAVNTVVKKDGKIIGYNTDFYGMTYMLEKAGIILNGKTVMILGTGGTSKTATVVCKRLNAKEIIVVSRTGEVNYQNCYDFNGVQVIINTTPVGMYPNAYDKPIDISKFTKLEGIADAIYNPSRTMLIDDARRRGLKYTNALNMLVGQAKYASEYFTDSKIDNGEIDRIANILINEKSNVVLVGMPGSGKSTIGKAVAKITKKEFVDTDEEIVRRDGRDIPTIFRESGEEYFRALEKQVVKDLSKETGKVIATGGGVVKNIENRYPLSANGKIILISRDIEKLASDGRPLSKSKEDIERLYIERKQMYLDFADCIVENNGDIENAVKGVVSVL